MSGPVPPFPLYPFMMCTETKIRLLLDRIKICEKTQVRGIRGAERDEAVGGWKEEIRGLYSFG